MDLNNDGHLDLLSGSYYPAVYVLWGNGDGSFSVAEPITNRKGETLIPAGLDSSATHPFACDWDADGDLDLIAGTAAGTLTYIKNVGTAKKPAFTDELIVLRNTDDKPVKVKNGFSSPHVIDWDGDGDLDVISGSKRGGVSWAENIGTRKKPQLSAFVTLIEIPTHDVQVTVKLGQPINPSGATRLWVADVTGDGKLDLLVGDASRVEGVLDDELDAEGIKRKTAQLLQQRNNVEIEMKAVRKKIRRAILDDNEAAMEKYQEKLSELNERYDDILVHSIYTGFVWLFEQK